MTVIHDLGCSEPCTCGAWDRATKGESELTRYIDRKLTEAFHRKLARYRLAVRRVTPMPYRYEIYEAKDGWRWRCTAPNGEVVADSGEAYVSEANAKRAVAALEADVVNQGDQDG